jgi:quercetin dioxygenase-like cupin family protein
MFLPAPPAPAPQTQQTVSVVEVSRDSQTDAGEPLQYLATANPEVSSNILTIPQGGRTEWMVHPAPGYIYILEGTLTVEFEDGQKVTFHQGQAFLQARNNWHQGVNTGTGEMKFLAVFFGSKGLPTMLHPPHADHAMAGMAGH